MNPWTTAGRDKPCSPFFPWMDPFRRSQMRDSLQLPPFHWQAKTPFPYRVGSAVGGREEDPSAFAGMPFMNRLHPLLPETNNRYGCRFSSIHSPIVASSIFADGSICHHLHLLHNPHLSAIFVSEIYVIQVIFFREKTCNHILGYN